MLAKVIIENGVKKIQALTADTGTGAPVGTIIPMYKKSSPSGYLYCDGSTFDQTKYPLLYAYLGSNVLPDYREFALVGAEENTTDVYNASTNPNGTIHDHDVYTEGQAKDDQLQKIAFTPTTDAINVWTDGNPEQDNSPFTIINSNYSPSSGSYGSFMRLGFDSSKCTRSGTVTRGKRKAVYFYIKATSGLSENAQDNVVAQLNEERSYSTEEVNTGKKWIDGKPIYRKVVDCGALPNATSKSVAHNITNLDQVTKLQGIAKGTNQIPLPFMDISTPTNGVQLYYTAASIVVQTGGNRTAYTNTYIIIEYTKTTD